MTPTDLTANLEKSYFDYAVEVITDRALPRLEDGLKPVQRRILYAMHEADLRHDRPYRKSARVVGDVLGRYHPHGDSSVYDAMVRLAQEFSLREPLVDGQGNFGSIDGDNAAAMRYTEARLAKVAGLMMQDIDSDTVAWQPNFDSSLREPVILPAALPNLLVNGSSGVAVALATNLPPHNLGEVCDGLMAVAKRWDTREAITVDQLLKYIPGPDFPTGGVIYRRRENGDGEAQDAIRQAYDTGQGRLTNQARLTIEPGKNGRSDIIVTELPYAVKKTTILEKIAKEVRDGRISGVSDLRDESDYEGLRVVIEVSRGSDPKTVLEALLKYTNLRQTFGVINRALVADDEGDVTPKLLPLKEILVRFIAHRLAVIERRSRHELAEREARLHIVEGLLKALDMIDAVIAAIRKSQSADTARANLMKQFKFSELQAKAILAMQLSKLAALERGKLKEEGRELWARIKVLKELLASEEKRLAVVIDETQAMKAEFASPRRTVILDGDGRQATATEADLQRPAAPQVVVLATGGLKRVDEAAYSYRVKPGEMSKRAVDSHLQLLAVPPEGEALLVSSAGRGWQAPLWRLPESATFEELGLAKGEAVISVQRPGPLTLGTRQGSVKRIEPALTESNWAQVIGLADKDDEVLFAGSGPEVLFVTAAKVIRFAAEQVNPQQTPSARGVAGIRLAKGDRLVGGAVFDPARVSHLVTVSENGFVKRIPLAEIPAQGRGGQGVSLGVTKTTGPILAAAVIPAAGDIDVISVKGRRQRLELAAVPELPRDRRGDKLIGFDADDLPAALACLAILDFGF
ncbi:MAG: DNA gyrase subunit A [Anaerolineae bacterium]|nr:DNA gyrase subunit A [Anaerolineae bacterium]